MWPNPKETADLVTFTEEIVNGKLHFLRSESDTVRFLNVTWHVRMVLLHSDIYSHYFG